MSEHRAHITWNLDGSDFLRGKFSREHTWTFDGGATVLASASPAVVRPPLSNPAGVDPEEAFVASLASCHMLTFVYLASRAGFVVQHYEDDAVGTVTKNEKGVPWVSRVVLSPKVTYGEGKRPDATEERQLHHRAHEECFISNSVKSDVDVVV